MLWLLSLCIVWAMFWIWLYQLLIIALFNYFTVKEKNLGIEKGGKNDKGRVDTHKAHPYILGQIK